MFRLYPVFLLAMLCLCVGSGFTQVQDEGLGVYRIDSIENPLDKQPQYPGGEDAIFLYLENQVRLSRFDRETLAETVQTALIVFEIDKNGRVRNPMMEFSTYPFIDNLFTEAVADMPRWEPGEVDGEPVRSLVYLPVKYIIEEFNIRVVNTQFELMVGQSDKNRWLKWLIIGLSAGALGLLFLLD